MISLSWTWRCRLFSLFFVFEYHKLYLDVVALGESSPLFSSFSIRLESDEEIDVLLKRNFGYSVEKELESVSGIDNDVVFWSLAYWKYSRIVCNLEGFIAVPGLWGDLVIKGITDSGSGIRYNGFGVFGISERGGFVIDNGVGWRALGISIELISE